MNLDKKSLCSSLIHHLSEIGSKSKCIAWVFASRGTWCSCFACLRLWSWWLWGVLDFSFVESQKGTLVDCSWLVWSSSCVGCVASYGGIGVWCQLAREPPSEWITTTRTSLPASKWTSVKNHCVIIWFWGDWSSLLSTLVIDWFIHLHGGITFLPPLYITAN